MSRNGSGTYSLPLADVVAGTTIEASWANTTLNDIETALTNSLAKDGQTNPTANLPMNSFRHTGVAQAAALTDYARADQITDGDLTEITSVGGTGDAITGTIPLSTTAYASGMKYGFTAGAANTGAVTINLNGIGAVAVTRQGSTALVANDILSGMRCELQYDGTRFQLLNPANSIGDVTADSLTIQDEYVANDVISPAQLTANTNDWAPTGIASAYEIRFDTDAAGYNLTGISAGQVDGREIVLTNDGSNSMNITHEDSGSTAANRFDLNNDVNASIGPGQSLKIRYDGTASRWRLLGASGGAGGETDSGGNVIGFANKQATAGNYTLAADENMITLGTFTITSGHTITITSGGKWRILT
jgi:hypothetical protein